MVQQDSTPLCGGAGSNPATPQICQTSIPYTMVQLLFNINLMLAAGVGVVGIIMLTGMAMDAVSNLKDKQS